MADEIQAETLLLMGRIWRAHGLDGEVKVIPETEDPSRLEDLSVVYIGRTASTTEPAAVENVRYQSSKNGRLVILKLDVGDSRDDAERLRGMSVYARTGDVPPLEDDEYFLHDLIGLHARREDGSEIGIVESVLELPAQEVLVIAREGRKPAMVPAVAEFVVAIDLDERQVVIRPIEGLLDE